MPPRPRAWMPPIPMTPATLTSPTPYVPLCFFSLPALPSRLPALLSLARTPPMTFSTAPPRRGREVIHNRWLELWPIPKLLGGCGYLHFFDLWYTVISCCTII